MTSPDLDVELRRPVWDALSDLFLDTELDDEWRRLIAQALVASAYSPSEIETILWEEVYPVVECNLRSPVGEWEGFDLDWIERMILSGRHRRTLLMRIAGAMPYSPARMIRQEWQALLPFLPDDFRQEACSDCQ